MRILVSRSDSVLDLGMAARPVLPLPGPVEHAEALLEWTTAFGTRFQLSGSAGRFSANCQKVRTEPRFSDAKVRGKTLCGLARDRHLTALVRGSIDFRLLISVTDPPLPSSCRSSSSLAAEGTAGVHCPRDGVSRVRLGGPSSPKVLSRSSTKSPLLSLILPRIQVLSRAASALESQ